MSKRRSIEQSNTLFNYFQQKNNQASSNGKSVVEGSPANTKQLATNPSNDDSDEEIVSVPRKRNRIIETDSDSGSENESPNTPKMKKPKLIRQTKKQKHDTSDNESQAARKTNTPIKLFSFQKSNEDKDKSTIHDDDDNNEKKCEVSISKCNEVKDKTSIEHQTDIHSNWLHKRLEFLKPSKIRDACKRRPNEPDYDSRTLYVPDDFLNKLTPGMRQWWVLKSQHFDSILFFKLGKFYELYHMDAVVGVTQIGLSYMKGEFAHCGFPETAYGKMANTLIEKGFKVARVEQTETPELMQERCKNMKKCTKFDKVVNREICQISSKGTCIYTAQLSDPIEANSTHLFAISEKVSNGSVHFGVCFVDTSTNTVYLSEFDDDKHCSRLLVLLSEYTPGMFLIEQGAPNTHLNEIIKIHYQNVPKEFLKSKTQFYDASGTLEMLYTESYFKEDETFEWPTIFKEIADECLPKSEYELALKCLGACTWYLKYCLIDIQVLSMKKFQLYFPLDVVERKEVLSRVYMVLDSTTINNLNLLGGKGSLQHTLDHCLTAFGKRLLKQWICRPLFNVNKITERQNAVNELKNKPGLLQSVQEILNKLPDLERQVAKIHVYGNKLCAKLHPDSRAVFYEAKTYSKRKILDLIQTLKGFESAQKIHHLFENCESSLLRRISQFQPTGQNIDLSDTLQFFKEAFDQVEAEKEGKIIPKSGIDDEFDAINLEINEINNKINDYLQTQQSLFGCKLSYFGSDKKRFQIEVPESHVRKVPTEYQLESSKKGAKRYSTKTSRELLAELIAAEHERSKIILDLNRRIFEKFSKRHEEWQQVINCLSILDVVCSLATYASTFVYDICTPVIKPITVSAQISIESGRHPCIANLTNFVANDTYLGGENKENFLILTGPNMGGKSTLMRQISLIIIMGQIGSFVPARNCTFSLVDRIFTRMGAHDSIFQGQSTFFIELSEAAAILKCATVNSLVVVDELGRGTSTFDGSAIATAYVKKLLQIKCRTLFATHYHSLVNQFLEETNVKLVHMACMIENDDDSSKQSVVFLYQIADGHCPKSYGFNAARLAGLNSSIVQNAQEIGKQFEVEQNQRTIFQKIFTSTDMDEVKFLLSSLKM